MVLDGREQNGPAQLLSAACRKTFNFNPPPQSVQYENPKRGETREGRTIPSDTNMIVLPCSSSLPYGASPRTHRVTLSRVRLHSISKARPYENHGPWRSRYRCLPLPTCDLESNPVPQGRLLQQGEAIISYISYPELMIAPVCG